MISNAVFYQALKKNDIDFFCGVPDSLLKNFCAYLSDHTTSEEHIITANEGGAVALASGHHLATGKLPMVYLQNSGLGNIINPLLSLADAEVYGTPMLLLIGWRGEPGVKDEPQHQKQGRVQNALLEAMGVPYYILDAETTNAQELVDKATDKALKTNTPVAVVVRKNTFEPYTLKKEEESEYELSREEAIQTIIDNLTGNDIIISTTGKPSREVYEYRLAKGMGNQNDFLTVGSMGHCSQIALGVALHTDRTVFCMDGDGAIIMHMGALSIIGNSAPSNFKHIVLNNGAHDSVGGQPTVGFKISIPGIAKSNGYKYAVSVSSEDELNQEIKKIKDLEGPVLLEVRIRKGARKDLGRPSSTPEENKRALMKFLQSKE